MAARLMRIVLNHAQNRVIRPRLGMTASADDFKETSTDLVVDPATGALRVAANIDRPAFSESNSGVYEKLGIASYDFVDNNTPAGSWRNYAFSAGYASVQRVGGPNVDGAGAVTVATYPDDQGWSIGVFAYSSGESQNGVLIECGWNSSPTGTVGPSVRILLDGRLEVWNDGVRVGTASLSGTKGYGRASMEYLVFHIQRGRGRDMVVTTSKGGAAAVRCDWVDPEDTSSLMFPSSAFWWYVPTGEVTVMACPIAYETGAKVGYTRPFILAEAPAVGEDLEDMTGSDRFTSSDTAHIIGHPQGGDAAFAVVNDDLTAFVPDGVTNVVRMKLSLTSAAGITSPWVWGVHAAYGRQVASTADDPVDITPLLYGPVRLAMPDSNEGLTADFTLRDIEALETLAPTATITEGVPAKVEFYDPDGIDPTVIWLDGELMPVRIRDGLDLTRMGAQALAVDKLRAAAGDKARESLPFDGMPLCQPVSSGVSAVLLALREMGLDDSEVDLPDLGFRIPDVPTDGRLSPTGEWGTSAENGDRWGDVLERLLSRAPLVIHGMRPTSSGYKFVAVEPADTDPAISARYRTVESVWALDPTLTEQEAARWLYDDADSQVLPIEGNEVRVTGYDPGRHAPIAAVAVWDESADPTTAPALRMAGWKGRRLTVEASDPGLTTMDSVQAVCRDLYAAVVGVRTVDSYVGELPIIDGVPVWRGEIVTLENFLNRGVDRDVRTSAWTVLLDDESGAGYLPSWGLPPSRRAQISGGAIVGHGGATAFEIASQARANVGASRRYRGFDAVESISPIEVAVLTIP